MLLHLGEDRSVRLDEVEALLDFRLFVDCPANRDFLHVARGEGRVRGTAKIEGETLVLAGDRLFLSALSRATLARRATTGWPLLPPMKSPARIGNRSSGAP